MQRTLPPAEATGASFSPLMPWGRSPPILCNASAAIWPAAQLARPAPPPLHRPSRPPPAPRASVASWPCARSSGLAAAREHSGQRSGQFGYRAVRDPPGDTRGDDLSNLHTKRGALVLAQSGCGRPQSDVLGAALALSPPKPTWLVLTHPVGDNVLRVGLRQVIEDHHRRVAVALSSA